MVKDAAKLSKISPLDTLGRPMRDLRISVTDACNYRCPYCMPQTAFPKDYKFLKPAERLSYKELLVLCRLFIGLGVEKFRITGGEPLLRPGLEKFIKQLAKLEGIQDLALTTNGQRLADSAGKLAAAGLTRITVSMDALDPVIFSQLSGGKGDVESVLAGIDAALKAGMAPVKVNSVVIRGVNESQILPLAEYFRERQVTLRFIEYMDVGSCNGWQLDEVIPASDIRAIVASKWPLEPLPGNYRGEVASRYAYRDGKGELGFISSVSSPFCGDCNRLRLSADGKLFTCLFATKGLDLRTALRDGTTEQDLLQMVRDRWRVRSDRYSELRTEALRDSSRRRIEMFYIGG